jgi:hypothetical protein
VNAPQRQPEDSQMPLDLPLTETVPLREAFAQMALAARMSYDQAMADPVFAVCIRDYAEALERKRLEEGRGVK